MVRHRLRVWEGPWEAGQVGRYVEKEIEDILWDDDRGRRFLNTARSVSCWDDLLRESLK